MTDPNDPYAAPTGGYPGDTTRSARASAPPSSAATPYDAPRPPATPAVPQPYEVPGPYPVPGDAGYPRATPYGGPVHPYAPRPTSGMAIASLVLGILWLYWIGSVLALIFGYVALGQIKRAPAHAPQEGRGMAIAGVVLGWVGIGTLLLLVGLGFVVASAPATYS